MFIEDVYIRQVENGHIDERRFVDKIYNCKGVVEDDFWREREALYEIFTGIRF